MEKSNRDRPLAQGIAAYQSTMKTQKDADGRNPAKAETGKDAVEGLLKTGQDASTKQAPAGLTRQRPFFKKLPASLPLTLEEATERDSKTRRVAKFLILIGGEEAAGILSQLDMEQVEAISREIASIRGISKDEAAEILDEFRSLLSSSYDFQGVSGGGIETARRLLYTAFGPQKGEEFLQRTLPETRKNPFAFLEDFNGEQIALLLKEEPPAAEALILSRLSPKLSASTLMNTREDKKADIIRRIAHQGEISPDVLERIAGALREKARHFAEAGSTGDIQGIDGKNALAAILKSSDAAFEDRLLRELKDIDADLSEDLKDRIHTLEDLLKADDRPLQEKLRTMSEKDIVLLLKGRSDEFREKILSNVSVQRRLLIREEEEILGPVPRRDINKAVKDFLSWFRQNREEGRILLIDDEDVVL